MLFMRLRGEVRSDNIEIGMTSFMNVPLPVSQWAKIQSLGTGLIGKEIFSQEFHGQIILLFLQDSYVKRCRHF